MSIITLEWLEINVIIAKPKFMPNAVGNNQVLNLYSFSYVKIKILEIKN